ncbi:MAG: hypothetical protein DI565_00585 [Ancylobacter novellus]|uniref:Uncharacterized protein n=1 Tax=Ancylobacter novellus TaxID=921 RepID=A0A2W5KPE3_ANCNO|nr:MAG: hypothetical protein DI565_00585 [Ancylobacter novellus]
MSATGLSPDAAAALAANLKLFQAELELFSAGVVFAAAVGRLQEARAAAALQASSGSAATAAGIAAREAQIQRVADAFRMPLARTDDMRAMLDDLAAARSPLPEQRTSPWPR